MGFIFNLLSKLPYVKEVGLGLIVALLLATGVLWMNTLRLEDKMGSLNSEITTLTFKKEQISAALEDYKYKFNIQKGLIEDLSKNNNEIIEKNNNLNKELEGYKNREETVIAKPSLVERRINNASEHVLHEWECTPNCD